MTPLASDWFAIKLLLFAYISATPPGWFGRNQNTQRTVYKVNHPLLLINEAITYSFIRNTVISLSNHPYEHNTTKHNTRKTQKDKTQGLNKRHKRTS